MTVEGISGGETTPTTAQDTILLFSRMLLSGADHTVSYFDSRVTNNWSYAYQLAKAVCFTAHGSISTGTTGPPTLIIASTAAAI
jgi:hypothetical protein